MRKLSFLIIFIFFILSSCVKDLGKGFDNSKYVTINALIDTVIEDTVDIQISMQGNGISFNNFIVLDDNKDTVFKKYFADTTEKDFLFQYIKKHEDNQFYLYLISTPINSDIKTEYYKYFGLF